ncbi:hypothetical protein G3I59_29705 [Amycolatopsis rubida]|uniref:Uncharacterized protein n=1 Tax=Amycolatopsis rubida TaxID=112413 RepID=A0ABX0C0J0_9PSEU|nr:MULTISPECIES: hypothetical protein [Amycolatopsis]MYW94655.1 hypothetical protein [Amycolatopsis rubida]NEC59643.1 hypothetical protein [Amycolatopsis rubida]OAP27622.1 hypothetical protein A4R44_01227 [Amycolatopsis sp. M39]
MRRTDFGDLRLQHNGQSTVDLRPGLRWSGGIGDVLKPTGIEQVQQVVEAAAAENPQCLGLIRLAHPNVGQAGPAELLRGRSLREAGRQYRVEQLRSVAASSSAIRSEMGGWLSYFEAGRDGGFSRRDVISSTHCSSASSSW